MNQHFDFISQSVNLFREVSTALLSGSEQMISLQLDGAQSCVARGSDHWRLVCSGLNAMQGPGPSADMVQSGMRNAIAMTRDNVLAASDYQLAALHLLRRQGTELQKAIAESFNQHLANIGREHVPGK